MSDDELLALLEMEEANCISSTTGALAEQRRKALQYYYGQPYGNEIDGRSQVVTTEVKDAVEGILPSLMAIFASSDEIVRFEPQNLDDDAAAQQATDYCNHVFSRLNNGFLALYCLFKDALLQKNGYIKVYWEDYTDKGIETYTNISGPEAAMLLQDPELELEEAEVVEGTEDQYSKLVFRRTHKYGKICIDPIPPEEVLISRETPNDLSKARFVEHRTLKTISEIRKMGFDIPDDIQDFAPGADFNMERVERLKFDDDYGYRQQEGTNDPTTRKVWLVEAYLYVDYDGDGIAEFRKITKVGHTILDNVEFDSLPIIGGTAIVMPHKHYGLSVYDLLGDIQLIKSTVTRQLLDNAYVANNGRMVVLDGMVNMNDLLTARPNGIVRAKTMNAVQRLDQPVLGAPFYGLLEYFDTIAQKRVGATGFPNAVDPDAINSKAAFVDRYAEAAMERIHLMARILAEGPVKQIFWKILELEAKHRDKPRMARLRGQWVQVDPREWRNKFDMTVTVGIGTGSQQTVLNGAMGILQIQQGMVQAGLGGKVVMPENIFQAGRRYAKAVFPKDADVFFTDPNTVPPEPPKPDPEIIKLQLQDKWKEMADAQKRDKAAMDAALQDIQRGFEAWKVQFESMVKSSMKDKDHQADSAKHILDMANQQRQMMMEKISELRLATDKNIADEEKVILQGKVDSMLEAQRAQADLLREVLKISSAERETEVAERDKSGKVKKTVSRVKKGN